MVMTAFALMMLCAAESNPPQISSGLAPVGVPAATPAVMAPVPEVTLTPDATMDRPSRRACHLKGRYIDVLVQAGATMPNGDLFNDAQIGPLVGGGLSKEVAIARHSAARLNLSYNYARLAAKQVDRAGDLTVHAVLLRADYLFGHWRTRPFVGIGIGLYPWRGDITNRLTGAVNSQKTIDFGVAAAIGADIHLCPSVSVAPELTYTRIAGKFSDNLWGAQVAARWSL